MSRRPPSARPRRVAVALALYLCAAAAGSAVAQETECRDLCPVGWPAANPCVVTHTVTVVPDSTIDCSDHDVEVTGGDILVHDGGFTLKTKSLLVTRRAIIGDCPDQSGAQSFSLEATGDITIGPGGRLRTSCPAYGGFVGITAGGAVTIGGRGIAADATAPDVDAGGIAIEANGPVTTTAPLRATIAGGTANGGEVNVFGSSITLGNYVTVAGSNFSGQGIRLSAIDDITITDHKARLNARGSSTDGGEILMDTAGTIRCAKPLNANGTGPGTNGGVVELTAGRIILTNGINVAGDNFGGRMNLEATGPIELGTGAHRPVRLNATGSRDGAGGLITIESKGNDVTLGDTFVLDAGNTSSGEGGSVAIDGIDVTAARGSFVTADGGPGTFGDLIVNARGLLTYLGTLRARSSSAALYYRCADDGCQLPIIGPDVEAEVNPDEGLPPPCPDGYLRPASEQCDGSDLAGQTCESLGFTGGFLDCTETCTFDTTNCN